MSTTSVPTNWQPPACPNCGKPAHGSLACEWAQGWPEPPKVEITGNEPLARIASSLERIAAALEGWVAHEEEK